MLMESRAAWANAPALRVPTAAVANVIRKNLRVTVLASGCDAPQFMTGRLRIYFMETGFISPSQNSLLRAGRFRITRSDVADPRSHARPPRAQFRHPGRPGLPGRDDPPPGRGRVRHRKPALWQRRQLLGDARQRWPGVVFRGAYRRGADRPARGMAERPLQADGA